MVSKLRRLIADHADLHNSDLPPYYLFPAADGHAADDLSQLSVLLTGPHGTPYADGLWRLHLRIPDDYPASPPKAAFKTRIWHPNVEESTGAVCVDTLKRDWESKLTLRDILVTISCLLIHPNPDSALNSSAGALLQDDYSEFARQAKLMTSIHAPIPNDLKQLVLEAKQRGEDPTTVARMESASQQQEVSAKAPETRKTGLVMKTTVPATSVEVSDEKMQSDDSEDLMDDYKENDPSLSPEPIVPAPSFSRRSDPDKRPLSVISTASPFDTDVVMYESSSDDDGSSVAMTSSERNIAANLANTTPASSTQGYTPPETQSQKLSGSNTPYEIYEDDQGEPAASPNRRISFGKENLASALFSTKSSSSSSLSFPTTSLVMKTVPLQSRAPLGQSHNNPAAATRPLEPTRVTKPPPSTGVRKGMAAAKRKPRLGLRRL